VSRIRGKIRRTIFTTTHEIGQKISRGLWLRAINSLFWSLEERGQCSSNQLRLAQPTSLRLRCELGIKGLAQLE
jgi:hypothetical protein